MRLRAVGEEAKEIGQLRVAVGLHEPRDAVAPAPAARLANDGQRRGADVGQDDRAIAGHELSHQFLEGSPPPCRSAKDALLRKCCGAPHRRRTPPAGFISPAQPTLVAKPPSGSTWLHEVKHDGYRILARKQGERVKLWSRYGTDFTDRLPRIAEAVRGLPAEHVLVDGEAVVFRPDGLSTSRRCSPRGARKAPRS